MEGIREADIKECKDENGATTECKDEDHEDGTYVSRIGDVLYGGPGSMFDGTECTCDDGLIPRIAPEGALCNPKAPDRPDRKDCDRPFQSPQEGRVCGADPDVVCGERRPGQRPNPGRSPWGRMLEEGKPQRRKLCATCVAVGAAVAGGVASGVAGGVTNHVLNGR